MRIDKKDSAKVGKLAKQLRDFLDKLEDKYYQEDADACLYASDNKQLDNLANQTAAWWLA